MFGLSLLLVLFPIFGATTISSTICDIPSTPTFVTQSATTTATTDIISAKTSPSTSVDVSDNSQSIATLTSDSSGDFSLQVSLALGSNSFSATATNSCGSSASTHALVLTRDKAPASSSSTSGSATEGSATSLAVSGSTTPSAKRALSLYLQVPAAAHTSSGISTAANSIFLGGSTSGAAQITIYDNGTQVASLTAANNGTFGVSVPLLMGVNHILIQVYSNGQTTTQTVTYVRTAPLTHKSDRDLWLVIGIIILVALLLGGWLLVSRHRKAMFEKGNIPNELT